MIPSSSKFPTRVQFLNFRARARQLTTPHLRLMLDARAPGAVAGLVGPRLSVIVPIKVSKRAVVRNSFKRLVYDLVWKKLQGKTLDCIVIFKPIALLKGKVSQDLIAHELSQLTDLH